MVVMFIAMMVIVIVCGCGVVDDDCCDDGHGVGYVGFGNFGHHCVSEVGVMVVTCHTLLVVKEVLLSMVVVSITVVEYSTLRIQ